MTPEEKKARRRAYWQQNKERLSARQREWQRANRDKTREYSRRYSAKNPEKMAEYSRRGHARNGKRKEEARILKKYGLTNQERLALFEASDGLCAACYEAVATEIDHCHDTGRVRGAVCKRCNLVFGHVGDRPDLLQLAAEYLSSDLRS